MAEFALPLTAEGAVTAPTNAYKLAIPAAESVTYLDTGEMNVLEIPEFGWGMADGSGPLRFAVKGSILNAGGLAPGVAPTLAITGATRATIVGSYTGQPVDGETFVLGPPGSTITVTWKDTLVFGAEDSLQVKISAVDDDGSYTNLQKFINQTGTLGVDYFYGEEYDGPRDDDGSLMGVSGFAWIYDIECSALDTGLGTITIRAVTYGTLGNAYASTESVTNFSWATSTFTGGVDGTSGTDPGAGVFRYFYTWFREADGAETGRSPIAEIEKVTNASVDLSALTASADSTFDYTNVYRTAKGGVEFYLAGAIARAGTTLTDAMSDSTLVRGFPWNDTLYRAYAEGMPPRGRALALWKDRLWTLGSHKAADYSHGTVAVTVDSATVTFSIKGVTEWMVGRTFIVDSTSEEYLILSVSESGPTAVLNRVYEGSTNGTATFRIIDKNDRSRLQASVAFKYNQMPFDESPGRVETDDDEGGTALLATTSRLFAFSKSSVISVTGLGLDSWEVNKISDKIGCVAPRMIVGVAGGGVFLSESGIYAIGPNETISSLSSPKTAKGSMAQGIDDTIARIEWAHVNQGYMLYDQTDQVVVIGVPMDGATSVNYEIILDLQNGAWSLYKRAEWSALTGIALPGGDLALFAGDRNGNLWHANVGESDGFYGTEAVQTLSGAQTVRVLTVSGTPYTGTAEVGKPAIILYADGSTVAYAKVASSTTSTLTLAEDLDTAPAASDQVVLGGIAWQAKSGWTTFGEEYRRKWLRNVTIRHAPTDRGEYYFSFAVDNGTLIAAPVGTSIGSLSESDGKIKHKTQYPGDSHQISLRGFKPGGRAILRGGVFDVKVRENGQA